MTSRVRLSPGEYRRRQSSLSVAFPRSVSQDQHRRFQLKTTPSTLYDDTVSRLLLCSRADSRERRGCGPTIAVVVRCGGRCESQQIEAAL